MNENTSIITITPPEPHSVKQRLIMNAFQIPGLTEIWVCCGTKFGKTLGASAGIANGVTTKQEALWRWVAPIYEQSKIGYEYCKRIMPKEPLVEYKNNALEILVPGIKSSIKFHHGSHAKSLEGQAVSGYVFDEAAKMHEDVYAAAKTTRTVTRGTMMFISTPYGKNWFYKKCMEAREEMLRARHEKRQPTKIFITARTMDNPNVPRESIEEARRELPARLYRQYYLAEFMDDGSVFTGYRECMDGPYLDLYGEHHQWFADQCETKGVVIGVDWAKSVDYTVFIAVDHTAVPYKVVGFERFHKRTYTEAIRQLVRFSRKFKNVDMVWHDKTGVGEAIDDQLAYTDLTFDGIRFSAQSKSEMVNRLMTGFEQKNIVMPRWGILQTELEGFEVKVNSLGNMRYEGLPHDDTVCALMLAYSCALQYGDRNVDVRWLEDLPSIKESELSGYSSVEEFYKDLSDDDF